MRELIILGTASQAPTRLRNHNGYVLRWDDEVILFDPGEGTQRQMLLAGVSATDITRICITHLHGDHCLGLPGVIQRLSLDRVERRVPIHFPASGAGYIERLRHASAFHEAAEVVASPVPADGPIAEGGYGVLYARRLDHLVDAYGYRLVEPDGRRMLPDRLAELGVSGPDIGDLQRNGVIEIGGRRVGLEAASAPRRGQRFAFVMDTRLCPGVPELAREADLLVIESTFLDEDAELARDYGHLTAAQAGTVAAAAGVRNLVLTHFSQRYTDPERFGAEAAAHFGGEIVVAEDLMRVPVPPRQEHRKHESAP